MKSFDVAMISQIDQCWRVFDINKKCWWAPYSKQWDGPKRGTSLWRNRRSVDVALNKAFHKIPKSLVIVRCEVQPCHVEDKEAVKP